MIFNSIVHFFFSYLNYSIPCGIQGGSESLRSNNNNRVVGGTNSDPGIKIGGLFITFNINNNYLGFKFIIELL